MSEAQGPADPSSDPHPSPPSPTSTGPTELHRLWGSEHFIGPAYSPGPPTCTARPGPAGPRPSPGRVAFQPRHFQPPEASCCWVLRTSLQSCSYLRFSGWAKGYRDHSSVCKAGPKLTTPLHHQPGCFDATPPPARPRARSAGAFAEVLPRAAGSFPPFVSYHDLRRCFVILNTLLNSVSMFNEHY